MSRLGCQAWSRGLYDDAEPETKHRIAQALFEKVEVLGPNEIWLHPSVEAEERGPAAAMGVEFRVELRQLVGARGLEPTPTT